MATIIQQPTSLSFSKNLKKFEISASSEIRFKLSQGGSLIVDESYLPNSQGKVIIDVENVIANYLTTAVPVGNLFNQSSAVKTFSAQVDTLPPITFTVIRGGVENLSDTTANFLASNWLTWQPQVKRVTYSQPEWLTYYAISTSHVKVRYYLKDENSQTITVGTLGAGACYSVNMQFAHIMTLLTGEKYGYYDVWIEDNSGQRLTYIQRYVYRDAEDQDEIFVFENSLGGIDTVCMTGSSNFTPEVVYHQGSYDDVAIQIDNYFTRLYDKSTGWISKQEGNWLFDFFNSYGRYKLVDGVLRKITLQDSSISDSSLEDLKSYSFIYRFSEDRGLLNIHRSMDVPPVNLEISIPDNLFFLAPRLVDFQSAALVDELLFPVQSPFSQFWQKLSWGAIWQYLYDKVLASAIGLMAHVHDNFSVISALSEDSGKLKYKGESIIPDTGLGVQLGESSQTAYRGDRGKTAYDHSQNNNIHFANLEQKKSLIDSLSTKPISIGQVTSGMLVTTLIPNIASQGYINIEISGFGKIDAGPFSWRGQVLFITGAFADASIKSIYEGELLDVRIFIHDALVKLWVTALAKSIMDFQNIKVYVKHGDDPINQVDEIVDSAMLTDVISLRKFNDFEKTYLRQLTPAEQAKLSRAVTSVDNTEYKIWTGNAADYSSVTKDPNTLYFIQ